MLDCAVLGLGLLVSAIEVLTSAMTSGCCNDKKSTETLVSMRLLC